MEIVDFITSSSVATVAVLSPIVLALVSGIKSVGMESRWAFPLSLVLGITAGVFFGGATIALNVLLGIIIGLSASGLYSGVKKVVSD